MSEHSINLVWNRNNRIFERENYTRDHTINFGVQTINASAAPGYGGNADCVDPEQMLLAALSSCHMLTFLAVVANRGYVVESYEDNAIAQLDKNADGKIAVIKAILKPKVKFFSDKKPTEEDYQKFHERAHAACFIANSIKTEVKIISNMI